MTVEPRSAARMQAFSEMVRRRKLRMVIIKASSKAGCVDYERGQSLASIDADEVATMTFRASTSHRILGFAASVTNDGLLLLPEGRGLG